MATSKGDRKEDGCSDTCREEMAIHPPPMSMAAASDYSQAFSADAVVQSSIASTDLSAQSVQDRSPHTNTTVASSSQ